MSRALVWSALCVLWLAAPPALAAGTDYEKFQKRVARFAYASGDADYVKPRRLCICTVDAISTQEGQTGVLVYSPASLNQQSYVSVSCVVPFFDAEGALSGGTPCESWTLLSR